MRLSAQIRTDPFFAEETYLSRDLLDGYLQSADPYQKELVVDVIVDLQLRMENVAQWYRQWAQPNKAAGLLPAIEACKDMRKNLQAGGDQASLKQTRRFIMQMMKRLVNAKSDLFEIYTATNNALPTSPTAEQTKNYRIVWLTLSHRDYTQEEIDHIIFNKVINTGCNLIKVDKMRQICSYEDTDDSFPNLWAHPVHIDNLKRITKAAHRMGVLVDLHTTTEFVYKAFQAAHPDWSMINARTGEPAKMPQYRNPGVLCPNNIEFQNYYIKKLKHIVQQTNIDLLSIDEIQFFNKNNGGCATCRREFKQESGYDIPDAKDLDFWQNHDKRYQAWTAFKYRIVNLEFRQKIAAALPPHMQYMNYLSTPPATWSAQASQIDYEQLAKFCDLIGNEAHGMYIFNPWVFSYNWKSYWTQLRYVHDVAGKFDKIPWALFPTHPTPLSGFKKSPFLDNFIPKGHPYGEEYFTWALTKAAGLQSWFVRPYRIPSLFERKYEDVFAGSARETQMPATVGIFYSENMKHHYIRNNRKSAEWHKIYYWEMRAWGELCAKSNMPFTFILDGGLTLKSLEQFKLVVLPNAAFLSDQELQAIKQYIQQGGSVVATHETSLYDRNGTERDDFGLADLMGYSAAQQSTATPFEGQIVYDPAKLKQTLKTAQASWPATDFKTWRVPLTPNGSKDKTTVLASFVAKGKTDQPALLYRDVGRGHFYYMPAKLALETIRTPEITWRNNAPGTSNGSGYQLPDPALNTLLSRIIQLYGNTQRAWNLTELPEGIFATVLRSGQGGYRCHLLNVKGLTLEQGQQIAKRRYVSYPSFAGAGNATLTINLAENSPSPQRCRLISPDFPDAIDLPFSKSKTQVSITIPLRRLHRYMIVVLD